MSLRGYAVAALLITLPAGQVAAQENADLARAIAAREAGDFSGTVDAARAALGDLRDRADRLSALEAMAYAYFAMDSTDEAVAALEQFVTLDADRDFDPDLYPPAFISLHTIALRSQLFVRQVAVDSQTFVAGNGELTVAFEVTRPAVVDLRVIGPGVDTTVGAGEVGRLGFRRWNALGPEGQAVAEGTYTLLLRARELVRDAADERGMDVVVRRGAFDTLPHVTSLPGFVERPEFARPPPDWKPMGLATLVAAASTGIVFAIETGTSADFGRRELITINVATLASGLVMSLRRPPPQPVEANIEFNRLLREQIEAENERLRQTNVQLRRQVVLTVVPVAERGTP